MKSSRPSVSLVVAALKPDLGIGLNGKLPWRLKKEITYFRDLTSRAKDGHINAVIMGRKTWDSIPQKFRPLPGRVNVILSRSFNNCERDGAFFYNSVDSALDLLSDASFAHENKKVDKIFVIGGAQIYNSIIDDPKVERLLITELQHAKEPPELDTFLSWDLSKWEPKAHDVLEKFAGFGIEQGVLSEGDYNYRYTLWQRK